jgi:hypothetical protein
VQSSSGNLKKVLNGPDKEAAKPHFAGFVGRNASEFEREKGAPDAVPKNAAHPPSHSSMRIPSARFVSSITALIVSPRIRNVVLHMQILPLLATRCPICRGEGRLPLTTVDLDLLRTEIMGCAVGHPNDARAQPNRAESAVGENLSLILCGATTQNPTF